MCKKVSQEPGDGIGLVVLDFFFMAFWALSWAGKWVKEISCYVVSPHQGLDTESIWFIRMFSLTSLTWCLLYSIHFLLLHLTLQFPSPPATSSWHQGPFLLWNVSSRYCQTAASTQRRSMLRSQGNWHAHWWLRPEGSLPQIAVCCIWSLITKTWAKYQGVNTNNQLATHSATHPHPSPGDVTCKQI